MKKTDAELLLEHHELNQEFKALMRRLEQLQTTSDKLIGIPLNEARINQLKDHDTIMGDIWKTVGRIITRQGRIEKTLGARHIKTYRG